MKEFFKKHKIAIFATGGVFLLLYLFYKYEQNSAANSAADSTSAPLSVGGTPLVYGSGGGLSATGTNSSDTAQTASGLNDYLTQPAGTSSVVPNPSGSGVPSSSVSGTGAFTNDTVTTPSQAAITAATASPNNPGTVSPAEAAQVTQLAQAAVASSPCAYALNGINNSGVPTCGPNGYQYSGTGGLSTIDPDVNGVLPGQAGYAAAVQAQLNITQQMNPGDSQDIANYQALLNAYGGLSSGESEGSSVPAGATQTAAPVPISNDPRYSGDPTLQTSAGTGVVTTLPAGSNAVTVAGGRGAQAVIRTAAVAPPPASSTTKASTTTSLNNVRPIVKIPATGVNR